MRITYEDSVILEAVLLSATDGVIRAALEGAADASEFRRIGGTWVSEDGQPVRIEFEWERIGMRPELSEADFFCPPELAARVISRFESQEAAAEWAVALAAS